MTNIDHNNYKKHTKNYKSITEKNRRHEKNKQEKQLISGNRTKQPPEREREIRGFQNNYNSVPILFLY